LFTHDQISQFEAYRDLCHNNLSNLFAQIGFSQSMALFQSLLSCQLVLRQAGPEFSECFT